MKSKILILLLFCPVFIFSQNRTGLDLFYDKKVNTYTVRENHRVEYFNFSLYDINKNPISELKGVINYVKFNKTDTNGRTKVQIITADTNSTQIFFIENIKQISEKDQTIFIANVSKMKGVTIAWDIWFFGFHGNNNIMMFYNNK
ncbi:MAG: hypothetical protein E6772_14570 [Dysgonomonas sp.]|nr:hypothetical protein [Dysgonomonas sp.]